MPKTSPSSSRLTVGGIIPALFAAALGVAVPLPVMGQSNETCIAYMEADAAYEALSHATPEQIRALGESGRRWLEANQRRSSALDAVSAAFPEYMRATSSYFRDSKAAQLAVGKALRRYNTIRWQRDSDVSNAEKTAARENLDAAKAVLATVDAAFEEANASYKMLQAMVDAATHDRRVAHTDSEIVRAKARAAGKPARDAAYLKAYKGPTSKNASVMEKLITADRERCRRRLE